MTLVGFGLGLAPGCKDRAAPDPPPTAERSEAAKPAEPNPIEEPEEPELPPVSELAAGMAAKIDAKRYEEDLRFIAAVRPPGSDHWQAVQDRCAEVFEAAGLETTRFRADGAGVSVIARKPGTNPKLPAVVVGGHYDHIEDCPGADDNASGTAAVLELARVFAAQSWEQTLVFACWDEEESGLLGSRAWVDAAVAQGDAIAWYLNFDAIAYADSTPNSQTLPPGVDMIFPEQVAALEEREFRADFIVLLADDAAREVVVDMRSHAAALGLFELSIEVPGSIKNEDIASELQRSDHASFWRHEIPALFFSDTAGYRTDTYHCGGRPDTVETLDMEFAVKVVRTAAGGLAQGLQSDLPQE